MFKRFFNKLNKFCSITIKPNKYYNHFRDNFIYFDGENYFLVIGEREYGEFNFCIYDEVYYCDRNGSIYEEMEIDSKKSKEIISNLISQLRSRGVKVFYQPNI